MTYDIKFSHVLAALLVMPSYKPVNEKLLSAMLPCAMVYAMRGSWKINKVWSRHCSFPTTLCIYHCIHLPHIGLCEGSQCKFIVAMVNSFYMCSCAVVVLFPDRNNTAWERDQSVTVVWWSPFTQHHCNLHVMWLSWSTVHVILCYSDTETARVYGGTLPHD